MKLYLPTRIVAKEVQPLSGRFPITKLVDAARKVSSGLGITLGGAPTGAKFIKIPLTGPHGAARMLFLFHTGEGYSIPLLLRDKNDAVGKNMSSRNPLFVSVLAKNLLIALEDIENGDFELLEM